MVTTSQSASETKAINEFAKKNIGVENIVLIVFGGNYFGSWDLRLSEP